MQVSAAKRRKRFLLAGAAGALLVAGAALIGSDYVDDCDVCVAATQIILQGTVAQNCSLDVTTASGASNLPLATEGPQRVQVGSVSQRCNKKAGYTITIASNNCTGAPTGAKVADSVSGEYLRYSAEFTNPTTGGSQASVAGLLASACASQIGRNVTNAKIKDEISTVFVNFTGDDELAAGTYQDTLTLTMNIK